VLNTATLDLHDAVRRLAADLERVASVYLFGSRRYRTGSPRSDVDLLLEFSGEAPSDHSIARAARHISVYIDAFVVTGNVARSAINGSRIRADGDQPLAELLDGVEIFNAESGIIDAANRSQEIIADWGPVYTVAGLHGDPTADRRPIDYLIITALTDEFTAVETALNPYLVQTSDLGAFGRHLEALIPHARPGDDEVAIVCQSDRMGNVASALTTSEALARWAPRLVVLVGITGGLATKTHLGDLVVATQVFDYESGKVTKKGVESHGIKLSSSFSARQRLLGQQDLEAIVVEEARRAGVPAGCGINEGAYASGEKVVADRKMARAVSRSDRKIAAIEMESLGVADACRRRGVEFMVLKAVTDFADAQKSDDYRKECCTFASNVLVRCLRDRLLLPARTPMARSQPLFPV
jgi:nucleoside phosphorylase/predicted nucleotidyltransferase